MGNIKNIVANQDAQKEALATNNHSNGMENATFDAEMPKNPKMPTEGTLSFSSEKENGMEGFKGLPTISMNIGKDMCQFVADAIDRYKHVKKAAKDYYYSFLDMVILTLLTVASSMLPNVRFLYNGSWYYSNLMLIVVAMAGMGKGAMDAIFNIATPLHLLFRSMYKDELKAYEDQQKMLSSMTPAQRRNFDGEILEKPENRFFRIPADSTYAAFMKALVRMSGMGALLDTEIDTIVNAFKQDLGDYSVLVRKNFKHEQHSYYRKGEDEYCEIPEPKFSMALSGTLKQLFALMPSAENGFFSRIMYYFLYQKPKWMDAEDESDVEEDDKTFFIKMGERLLVLYKKLDMRKENPVRFRVTKSQLAKFNKFFSTVHANYLAMDGEEIHASVVRLAVMFQRIAMVLTLLRLVDLPGEEQDEALEKDLVCSNKDFNLSMEIVKVLLEHMARYFEIINNVNDTEEHKEVTVEDFGRADVNAAFVALPSDKDLTREDIVTIFVENGVPRSTAEKKIKSLCKSLHLKKLAHGLYRKGNPDEYLIAGKRSKRKSKAAEKK